MCFDGDLFATPMIQLAVRKHWAVGGGAGSHFWCDFGLKLSSSSLCGLQCEDLVLCLMKEAGSMN